VQRHVVRGGGEGGFEGVAGGHGGNPGRGRGNIAGVGPFNYIVSAAVTATLVSGETMFSGRESARFATERAGSELDEWVEETLSPLGDAEVRENGRIRIRPKRGTGDGWTEVNISGRLRERKNGDWEVELDYNLTVQPMGWVLGLLFIPLGIFIFITIQQTQTKLANRVRDVLADLEDEAE
jgi:hypothetical protein